MIARTILQSSGITAVDYRCDAGPWARPFAEQHKGFSVSYVRAGSFGYACGGRRWDLVPGSVLVGHVGDEYVCSHEHVCGDECLSFQLAADVAHSLDEDCVTWRTSVLPPLPEIVVLGELAQAAADGRTDVSVEEAGLLLAGRVARLAGAKPGSAHDIQPRHRGRVIEAACWIDANAQDAIDLRTLADQAGLSRFHFLRLFARVLGVTPHQHLIRARVRRAARLLAREDSTITETAYEAGFGDLSNFVRTFGRAAGMSPTAFRKKLRCTATSAKIRHTGPG